MPGDPKECRLNAARCLSLAERARSHERRQSLTSIAAIWAKLAAEIEFDQALLLALSEMEFGEQLVINGNGPGTRRQFRRSSDKH